MFGVQDMNQQLLSQIRYKEAGSKPPATMGRRLPPQQDPAFAGINAQKEIASMNNASALQLAGVNNTSAESIARQRAEADRYLADTRAGSERYGADQSLRAALAPVEQKNRQFQSVLPMFQSAMSGFGGQGQGSGGGSHWAGLLSSLPGYFNAPQSSMTPGLLKQQINSQAAIGDQRAQTDIKQLATQFGGRGFSGYGSPAAGQMAGNVLAANRANQARSALGAQLDFAQQQDDFNLKRQGLLQALLGDLLQNQASNYATQVGGQTGLLSALAGLV